jgi:hypothetical protein
MVLIGGTNIVGPSGTVRTAFSLRDFQSIDKPIVPVGVGAQAELGGQVKVDKAGVDILRFWKQSSGRISVRDELTQRFLDRVLGEDATILAGCPSLWLRGAPLVMDQPVTLFCPGPYLRSLSPRKQRAYCAVTENLCRLISKEGPTLCLVHQPDGLHHSFDHPDSVRYFPSKPVIHLRTIASAAAILSFRIHPLLVGVAHRVPGVLIALYERTKTLADTVGIPCVPFGSGWTAGDLHKMFHEALSHYPWETITRRLEMLERSFREHLDGHGLLRDDFVAKRLEVWEAPVPADSVQHPTEALERTPRVSYGRGLAAMVCKRLPLAYKMLTALERFWRECRGVSGKIRGWG